MGKIYINCVRCGKDLECEELDDVYTSKIDDTFLCKECFEEEKPEYIHQLKQQLVEKDKEINIKNNKLAELKKELTICKDKLRRKTQSNRDLQHRVHNVNTQLAIQELEKLKEEFNGFFSIPIQQEMFNKYIDKQIKELKR